MRAVASALCLCGVVLLSLSACSLLVDSSEIDAGCPSGERPCFGKCVPASEAKFGCEPVGCGVCPELDNAIFGCNEKNECVVAACLDGYGCLNCTVNLLINDENCGTCGNSCGGRMCVAGTCQ